MNVSSSTKSHTKVEKNMSGNYVVKGKFCENLGASLSEFTHKNEEWHDC